MIIELFKQVTAIQRCSGIHTPFIDFVKKYSIKYNYECLIDEANNILCFKKEKNPKLCLQSHYDIVCLVDEKIPTIIQEGNVLKAKDSTLGADNGIGCAYMLQLMSEHKNCEFLFTCDEEIGLIGANNITHTLNASFMLNLDSEEMGNICIGCAGGVDIFAKTSDQKIEKNTKNLDLYELEISDLPGGHSGVDIDKNIPNAIKLLFDCIQQCEAKLLDINAGQRINSIPKSARAIIASKVAPKSDNPKIKITKIQTKSDHFKVLPQNIIDFIYNFENGILKYDEEINAVIDSINLAIIHTSIDYVEIQLSARSMDNENLKKLSLKIQKELNDLNFEVSTRGKYPAWEPEQNEFSKDILEIHKKYFKSPKVYAIHAGLECAIFKEKYPNLLITSIGPDIFSPHSNSEHTHIDSVNKVFTIVQEIVEQHT